MSVAPLGVPGPEWARAPAAAFVAPPAAGIIVGLGFTLVGFFPALAIAPLYGALLGWSVAFVVGVPLHLLLRRWGASSGAAYAAAGLLLGLGAASVADAMSASGCAGRPAAGCDGMLGLAQGITGLVFGPLFGAIAGWVFRRMVRPGGGPARAGADGPHDRDGRTR